MVLHQTRTPPAMKRSSTVIEIPDEDDISSASTPIVCVKRAKLSPLPPSPQPSVSTTILPNGITDARPYMILTSGFAEDVAHVTPPRNLLSDKQLKLFSALQEASKALLKQEIDPKELDLEILKRFPFQRMLAFLADPVRNEEALDDLLFFEKHEDDYDVYKTSFPDGVANTVKALQEIQGWKELKSSEEIFDHSLNTPSLIIFVKPNVEKPPASPVHTEIDQEDDEASF
jgi:hypothetical protein